MDPLSLRERVRVRAVSRSCLHTPPLLPRALATTATATLAAPACLSILAASLHVAPVVRTSSTNNTRAFFTARGRRHEMPPARSESAAKAASPPGAAYCAADQNPPPHRNPQRLGQTTGQHVSIVLAAAKPPPPKHGHGHNQVRPKSGQLLPSPRGQHSADGQRKPVVRRPLHAQDRVARPGIVGSQWYNRIEPQRRSYCRVRTVLARRQHPPLRELRSRTAGTHARPPARTVLDILGKRGIRRRRQATLPRKRHTAAETADRTRQQPSRPCHVASREPNSSCRHDNRP